jgi:hypothetical protein
LEPPCAAPDRLSSLYVPVFAAQESAPARPKPAVICFPSCDGSPGFLVTSDLDRKSARFRVGWCTLSSALTAHFPSSTPILPLTGRHSLLPPSSTRRPFGSPCGSLTRVENPPGDQRAYHVPCKYLRRLGSASPPGVQHLRRVSADATHRTSTHTCPLAFWPKPNVLVGLDSTFGLFSVTTFISGSQMLTILCNPSPRPPWC